MMIETDFRSLDIHDSAEGKKTLNAFRRLLYEYFNPFDFIL